MIRWRAAILACVLIAPPAAAEKVLRYAFRVAETGFDPVQINDLYSAIILAHIFDPPFTLDYLARPFKVKANTAAGMPEVSADGKLWTIRIRPGIYFADDPMFRGKKRELTAQDYVYSLKRHFDPKNKSPNFYLLDKRVVGMDAVRKQALAGGKFDYDREVEGLRAIDRYTFRIVLSEPTPNLIYHLTFCTLACAVAREVIEGYPDRSMEKPVGTNAYRLAQWTRSSRIVLERNPNYREHYYDPEAAPDDPVAQAIAAHMRGKRLPQIDRVEVYIIEEAQPRWLAFLNAEHDLIAEMPFEFVNLAAPDGKKLVLEMATEADSLGKKQDELWRKHMDRIGIRMEFNKKQWPEHLRASRAGKLMMWRLGWIAGDPDADTFYTILYGPNKGQSNQSRFDLPAWNALYEKTKVMSDSPERDRLYREMDKLFFAYAPLKPLAHRIITGLAHPWVVGYRRNPVMREFWKYLDIDESVLPAQYVRAGRAAAAPVR